MSKPETVTTQSFTSMAEIVLLSLPVSLRMEEYQKATHILAGFLWEAFNKGVAAERSAHAKV
jgi:hypothetical protein